jgi:hypothetical protein
MIFKPRNLRPIAQMVVGDVAHFHYRSSYYITLFFDECELEFAHDGSSRVPWTQNVLEELLADPQPNANQLPDRFAHLLRVLMDKREAQNGDNDRALALAALNEPLMREGFEGFYGEDNILYVRHIGTRTVSTPVNIYRPLTAAEQQTRELLVTYLDKCSEDDLIGEVLLPMFRHLGYQRITSVGHKDKALEYGKDVWMRYKLPTEHVIYFGIQAKKGKLDSAGATKGSNANIAEIYNQVLMMLGHEIFDADRDTINEDDACSSSIRKLSKSRSLTRSRNMALGSSIFSPLFNRLPYLMTCGAHPQADSFGNYGDSALISRFQLVHCHRN